MFAPLTVTITHFCLTWSRIVMWWYIHTFCIQMYFNTYFVFFYQTYTETETIVILTKFCCRFGVISAEIFSKNDIFVLVYMKICDIFNVLQVLKYNQPDHKIMYLIWFQALLLSGMLFPFPTLFSGIQGLTQNDSQIAMFTWLTWGPPGSCRPQVGPMWAPWTLLSELAFWKRYVCLIFFLPADTLFVADVEYSVAQEMCSFGNRLYHFLLISFSRHVA